MNPWTTLASLLQQLPIGVRRTLYSIVTAAGAVLALAQLAGWKTIGPIDLDEALRTYALIASPTGVLALANAKPGDDSGRAGGDPAADWDLELPRLGDFTGLGRDSDDADAADPPFDPDEDFGGFDIASFEAGAVDDRADDEAFA